MIERRADVKAEFQTDQGHGELCFYRSAQHLSHIRANPRGNIHRQHRAATAIDPFDGRRTGLAHLATEAGTEQRVDQHPASFAASLPGEHLDTRCPGLVISQGGITL
ncbi:hypothetical protein SRABI70_02947 [Pseudomonas sp. Bi70]|nr:hypothetical protein SRABI70_02947 [Pseudomonas sp. Bi70]